jgi:hypothetical protein
VPFYPFKELISLYPLEFARFENFIRHHPQSGGKGMGVFAIPSHFQLIVEWDTIFYRSFYQVPVEIFFLRKNCTYSYK